MFANLGTRSRRIALLVVVALVVAATTAATVLAATAENGREVTAVRTVWESGPVTSTETNVESDVPGMAVTVKVPAGQKALLLITFSASSMCIDNSGTNNGCLVLFRVDGVLQPPGEIVFDQATDGGGLDAHSVQAIASPIGAGTHEVKVAQRVSDLDGSGTFQLVDPVLTVLRSRIP